MSTCFQQQFLFFLPSHYFHHRIVLILMMGLVSFLIAPVSLCAQGNRMDFLRQQVLDQRAAPRENPTTGRDTVRPIGNTLPIPNGTNPNEGQVRQVSGGMTGGISAGRPVHQGFGNPSGGHPAGFMGAAQESPAKNDAGLHDVFFVTPLIGWAVGEHGTIWNTRTGGRYWVLQPSGTTATLRCVHFINESYGIAVGGFISTISPLSSGVVLMTKDGGSHWETIPIPNLPILTQVRMTSPGTGWAAGLASHIYPSAMFSFSTDGRKWLPISGPKNGGLIKAEFYGNIGCGIEPDGGIYPLGDLRNEETDLQHKLRRRVRSLAMYSAPPPSSGIHAWMVGDGGVILRSNDAGLRWQLAETPVVRAQSLFDFKAVFAHGNSVWIAGSPGTLIFRSEDGGSNWRGVATGVTGEIRKITFFNPRIGFAVGDYGNILATEDGGISWNVQKSGGARVAMLNIVGRPEDVSWESLAHFGGDQGYLGGILLMTRRDSDIWSDDTIPMEVRLREAAVRCGGIGAWQHWAFFTADDSLLLPVEKILERFERENGLTTGEGGRLLLREVLVREIRKHRPSVVVCADPSGTNHRDPLRDILLRETLEAVRDAADSGVLTEHFQSARLTPWQVKRVVLSMEGGVYGEVNIPTGTLSSQLGTTIRETVRSARNIVSGSQEIGTSVSRSVDRISAIRSVKSVGFQIELDTLPHRGDRDFFTDISLYPGSEARRVSRLVDSAELQYLAAGESQRQNSITFIENSILRFSAEENGENEKNGEKPVERAAELASQMSPEAAVRMLLELSGVAQWFDHSALSLRLLRQVTDKFAGQSSSAEAARRFILTYPNENHSSISSISSIAEMALFLQQRLPELFLSPTVRFRIAADERKRQLTTIPESTSSQNTRQNTPMISDMYGPATLRYFSGLAKNEPSSVWGKRAATELFLAANDTTAESLLVSTTTTTQTTAKPCPLPVIISQKTPSRPFLDGDFEEEVWINLGHPITLHTPDNNTFTAAADSDTHSSFLSYSDATLPVATHTHVETTARSFFHTGENVFVKPPVSRSFGTQAMFMYDDEFLYIGVRCRKVSAVSYPDDLGGPRKRDVDLRSFDRVEILLDPDRTYSTMYRLMVDFRGCAEDSRGNDWNWNPQWFIATKQDSEHWMVEAAIPLESLGIIPKKDDKHGNDDRKDTEFLQSQKLPKDRFPAWGISVRRIVPGNGVECWNSENSQGLANGVGILLLK